MPSAAFLCVWLLFVVSLWASGDLASNFNCKTPSFDKRRCHKLYTGQSHLSWRDSSAACKATGQRLASMENGQLVKFVIENIDFWNIWIGLSRANDGQPDVWTNGKRLDAGLYPGVVLNVSRGTQDNGDFCSSICKPIALVNQNCTGVGDRLCETFTSNHFQVKQFGDVVDDVSSGQLVISTASIFLIDCVRKCHNDWTCQAISHDGAMCQLHFRQTGHSITVPNNATVYKRMN